MNVIIKQSTNVNNVESVTSSLIEKLYELAYEDSVTESQLDEDSILEGRLTTDVAYERSVQYLEDKFPNLKIIATVYYYAFRDPEMTNFCVQHFGGGEDGITSATLLGVTSFNSNTINDLNNSQITTLDLRPFANLELRLSYIKNMSLLENVYIKNLIWIYVLGFLGCGQTDLESGLPQLNKVVIDGVGLDKTYDTLLYGNANILAYGNVSTSLQKFKTLAIRRILPNVNFPEGKHTWEDTNNHFYIGDGTFSAVTITNFYWGEEDPEKVTLGGSRNEKINTNVVNMYVPIGCAQAYANSSTWGSKRTSGFLEYDFENDPDGIFE